MTEIPMEGIEGMEGAGGMPSDMPNNTNNSSNKKSKDPDQIAVEKGSDLALQSQGIPPPASTMIGKKIGEEYKKVKDGLDPGKQVEKGLNTTLGGADVFSKGAQPKEAADGMEAAKKATKNMADNTDVVNSIGESLDNKNAQPTEKQEAQAEERAESDKSKKLGI